MLKMKKQASKTTGQSAVKTKKTVFTLINYVPAGFPAPTSDTTQGLDLNQLLVTHPAATFFVRVSGFSMKNAGITSGDILVVDRAVSPVTDNIVVAIVDGGFTVKRIRIRGGQVTLCAENADFPDIKISDSMEAQVWGVVTHVIHKT